MATHVTDLHHFALFDSVTGIAFGQVFDSADEADDFLQWLSESADPRSLTPEALAQARTDWEEELSNAT